MGRILALDYGSKRTGIAVTDPLKIIANPLTTVSSGELLAFLEAYCKKEEVETFVVGMPKDLFDRETHGTAGAKKIILTLQKVFPAIPVVEIDERFTSKIAFEAMLSAGAKKSDRRNKSTIDKLSATLILQSYLEQA